MAGHLESKAGEVGEIGFRSGSSFDDNIEILYLSSIDIIANTTLKSAIKARALETEGTTFAFLKTIADQNNIDLLQLMSNSVLAHGGSSSQASQISQIINGFAYNGVTYYPEIFFPFVETTGEFNSVVLTKGLISAPTGVYYGSLYNGISNGSAISITQTVAEQNQLWVISADNGPGTVWFPFRKCYCTRGGRQPNGDQSTMGECSAGRKDDHCSGCGRANISGECSGSDCPGC